MAEKLADYVKLIPRVSNPEATFEDLMPDFLKLLQSGDRKELKRTRTALLRLVDEIEDGRFQTGLAMYNSCWTLVSLISAAQHQARVAENPGDIS
jgi:hypothetical protein